MKRKNILITAGAAAIVLAAGYPVSSWYLGKRIETAHERIDARIATLPFVRLVSHEYDRSVFSARETIVLEIPGALAEDAANSPSLRVTLKNAIQHGPFPNGTAFAAGSAAGVVEFDEEIRKHVQEAFGGKPAMEIHTVYNFTGGGRSRLSSPAFQLVLPGETEDAQITLSGDGLELSGEFSQGLARYSIRGGIPRFEMTAPESRRMTLTRLTIDAEQERLFPDELLFTGSQKISLAGLEIDPGPNPDDDELPKFALAELVYDLQARVSGEFIDQRTQIGAAGLRIGEQEYGPVAYDYSLNHLHARTLGALVGKLASVDPGALLDEKKRLTKAFEPMKSDFISLLIQGAVLSVDRVAFRLPEGDVSFNARFRLDDGKPEDFNSPLRLIGKFDTTAELSLPEKSVGTFLDSTDEEEARSRAETVSEIVDRLVRQGYAANDNGILRIHLVFNKGQLLLNDKPFNPMTLLMQ
ncbi:MAG: YdgA family protein [Candidatus Accumulibacter sp.]|nr:YdgA family protein [Accumulibacter sp.]